MQPPARASRFFSRWSRERPQTPALRDARSARALRRLFVIAVSATFAACSHPPPAAPPAAPWLVEVASIEGEGGLSRCAGDACEPVAERAVIAAGAVLRVQRGARVTLAVDESTDVRLADGAEIELAQEGGEHLVRTKRGSVVVARREGAPPGASNIVVVAGGRSIVVTDVAATLDVRAAADGEAITAVVDRGSATVRELGAQGALTTGQGVRWKGDAPPAPYARWFAAGDDESDAPARTNGAPAAASAR